MIQNVEVCTLICDRCNKDICEGTTHAGWDSTIYLRTIAEEQGWIRHEGEDICDDCYAYNDDDELEINDKTIIIKIIE